MKAWWNHLRAKWRRATAGCYGTDELSQFLVRAAFIILLLSLIKPLRFLYAFSVLIMLSVLYRCYSKNMEKRYAERERYLRFTDRWKEEKFYRQSQWMNRKTHRYFRCKHCKAILRVPRGMGKIEVRCPKCHATTIKKS